MIAVMIIVSLLVAIGIPEFQKSVLKSRLSEICGAVATIRKGQEGYYMQYNTYTLPFNYADLQAGRLYTPGSTNLENLLGITISSNEFYYQARPALNSSSRHIYINVNGCGWTWYYDWGARTWYPYGTYPVCKYTAFFDNFPLDCRP